MSAQSEPLALAAEFPAASRDEWLAVLTEVLRKSGTGGDPLRVLSTETYDGVLIEPLYTRSDEPDVGLPGWPPFVRGARTAGTVAGWDVRQRHGDPDPGRANAAVLADLQNGATSLWLVLGESGLAVTELPRALDGVHLDRTPVALDAGTQIAQAGEVLLKAAADRGVEPVQLAGTLGADPIGLATRLGTTPDLTTLVRLIGMIADYPALCAITVDGTIYHDAGGSDADELAVATSVGVAYLRALTDAGLSIDAALGQLEFRLAVTVDQFLSIAKLRAARRIWDRVAELAGGSGSRRGQRQHAVTSAAMMTRRDPWVNMLRTTIACFAAAVGGAEAITVLPFDSALGLPDGFGRRIARNTSSILHDESSLSRVIDPAGGSWYLESLTDRLAETAWDRFTALERSGGAANFDAVRSLIKSTAARRRDNIAHRRDPITGVSEFALADEPLLERPGSPAMPGGGLPRLRYAEAFEGLRDRADAAATRPTVFLAALGAPSAHAGRVGFATNLFQAGGIEPVVHTGDVPELVAGFRASGTAVACLCSSDATGIAELSEALKTAGARTIWLAGPPSDDDAGIDGYLHDGCDAVAVLTTTLADLGVST